MKDWLRFHIYFLLHDGYQNPLVFPFFKKILPHVFVHKTYATVYDEDGEDDTGYNAIRCADSGSWHPFGYYSNYYYYNRHDKENS